MASNDPKAIPKLLATMSAESPPEFQPFFTTFEKLWDQKLWHELTMALLEFYRRSDTQPYLLKLFKNFIGDFKNKISPTRLVEFAVFAQETIPDLHERLEFMQEVAQDVDKPISQDARIFALSASAHTQLNQNQLEGARKSLDQAQAILDVEDDVRTQIRGYFYNMNAKYYKSCHKFTNYFRTALLFLASVELETMSAQESEQRAYDLCLTALLSEQIYNFGELILHPIFQSIQDSPRKWMRNLVLAFNRGDIVAYSRMNGCLAKDKLLSAHHEFLNEKIALTTLMEAAFKRPPHDRALSFQQISSDTHIPFQDIEPLLMRAFSLGLLRGKIDQVDEIAHINWVQPKVLDIQQIEGMRNRLTEWEGNVNKLGTWIERAGKDVWTA